MWLKPAKAKKTLRKYLESEESVCGGNGDLAGIENEAEEK
jgi:hypothetical protein